MPDETITFYHAVPSRGAIVHWMLEEIGAPYRTELLNLSQGEQKDPAVSGGQSDGQGARDRLSERGRSPRSPRSASIWPTPSPTPAWHHRSATYGVAPISMVILRPRLRWSPR